MDSKETPTNRTQKADNTHPDGHGPMPPVADPGLNRWLLRRRRSPALLSSHGFALRTGDSRAGGKRHQVAPLTVNWTRSTLTRVQRSFDRTVVLQPGVTLGSGQRVQRFGRKVAASASQVRLVAFRRGERTGRTDPAGSGSAWGTLDMVLPSTADAPSMRHSEGEFAVGSRITKIQGPSIFSMPAPGPSSTAPVQRRPVSASKPRSERPKLTPKSRLFTHVEEVRHSSPVQETPPIASVSQPASASGELAAAERPAPPVQIQEPPLAMSEHGVERQEQETSVAQQLAPASAPPPSAPSPAAEGHSARPSIQRQPQVGSPPSQQVKRPATPVPPPQMTTAPQSAERPIDRDVSPKPNTTDVEAPAAKMAPAPTRQETADGGTVAPLRPISLEDEAASPPAGDSSVPAPTQRQQPPAEDASIPHRSSLVQRTTRLDELPNPVESRSQRASRADESPASQAAVIQSKEVRQASPPAPPVRPERVPESLGGEEPAPKDIKSASLDMPSRQAYPQRQIQRSEEPNGERSSVKSTPSSPMPVEKEAQRPLPRDTEPVAGHGEQQPVDPQDVEDGQSERYAPPAPVTSPGQPPSSQRTSGQELGVSRKHPLVSPGWRPTFPEVMSGPKEPRSSGPEVALMPAKESSSPAATGLPLVLRQRPAVRRMLQRKPAESPSGAAWRPTISQGSARIREVAAGSSSLINRSFDLLSAAKEPLTLNRESISPGTAGKPGATQPASAPPTVEKLLAQLASQPFGGGGQSRSQGAQFLPLVGATAQRQPVWGAGTATRGVTEAANRHAEMPLPAPAAAPSAPQTTPSTVPSLGQSIQRYSDGEPPTAAPEPTLTTVVQRAAIEDTEGEPEEINLADLAQQIYPLIKRMLLIERERTPKGLR